MSKNITNHGLLIDSTNYEALINAQANNRTFLKDDGLAYKAAQALLAQENMDQSPIIKPKKPRKIKVKRLVKKSDDSRF